MGASQFLAGSPVPAWGKSRCRLPLRQSVSKASSASSPAVLRNWPGRLNRQGYWRQVDSIAPETDRFIRRRRHLRHGRRRRLLNRRRSPSVLRQPQLDVRGIEPLVALAAIPVGPHQANRSEARRYDPFMPPAPATRKSRRPRSKRGRNTDALAPTTTPPPRHTRRRPRQPEKNSRTWDAISKSGLQSPMTYTPEARNRLQ